MIRAANTISGDTFAVSIILTIMLFFSIVFVIPWAKEADHSNDYPSITPTSWTKSKSSNCVDEGRGVVCYIDYELIGKVPTNKTVKCSFRYSAYYNQDVPSLCYLNDSCIECGVDNSIYVLIIGYTIIIMSSAGLGILIINAYVKYRDETLRRQPNPPRVEAPRLVIASPV